MDDINFDELDKAVNSALQQSAPKTTPTKEEPVAEEQTSTGTKPAPQTVVPQRRGQFMDMVHPSSDMTKSSTAPRPSRQAPTLQPLTPAIVETTAPKEPSHENSASAPVEPMGTEAVEAQSATSSEWPDPLDVMEQTEKERTESNSEQSEEYETPVENSPVAESEHTDTTSEPTEKETDGSPFISGAETEKRPLGAFTDTPATYEEPTPAHDELSPAADDVEQDKVDHTDSEIPREELPPVPLPQELTPEIVSVESDDPSQPPEKAQEEASVESSGVTASIPQQYQAAETSTDDQGEHPVFDTKEYHQPLTPPAKKGHAGLVISLIFIVIVLLGTSVWYAIAVLKVI